MIILNATTKSLEVDLDGAITTNQLPFQANYVDVTISTYTPIEADGATNSTTAVTLVAAPSSDTQRQVKLLTIYNADTVAAVVSVQYNNNGTLRTIIKVTLPVGATLAYTDGEGWKVTNSSGAIVTGSSTIALDDLTDVVITAAASGDYIRYNGSNWVDVAASQIVTDINASLDHGTLAGLSDDDHSQYTLLAGRSGGQVLKGGTASGDDLTLRSTTNATKGDVFIQDEGGHVIVGGGATASELRLLEPSGSGTNYTAFKAQAQGASITYTLPPDDGDSGEILSTDGSGSLTWIAAATGSGLEQTFRGLHVRTSPNADVAVTTVSVLGLDQWTADDGTLVDDTLTNNTAVISSSGAGGLDTGSEAASTWYEIYRIRKSSDGTLNTLLHRAKDYFLDEQQTTSDAELELREGATTNVKIGETFDTDVAGPLEVVHFQLNKQGSPTGRMWAEVYATSGGAPTGSVLATSDKLDVSLVAATDQEIKFIFHSPLTLVAGTTYWVGLAGDYTASATVNIRVNYNTAGGYAAGAVYAYDDTSWAEIVSGDDLWFKVYVTENDTAVTMPAGYDQKCKIGYVYNSSGSDLVAFTAHDKTVQFLRNQTSFASVTALIPTLTDYSATLPPTPVEVGMLIENTNATYQTAQAYLFAEASGFPGNTELTAGQQTELQRVLADRYQYLYLQVGAGTGTFYYPHLFRW